MQRMTWTLARSLRALTMATVILGTGSTALAGGPGRGHPGGHRDRFECGVCDVHTHHVHDEGGTLYLGRDRFHLWNGPGALVKFERSLERAGYRVYRHGNTFTIRSHRGLGRTWFRDGSFDGVILDKDWCSVTIRFHQRYRPPAIGHGRDRWHRREHTRTVVIQQPTFDWCIRW